jgi:phosphatidylglycerol---prolipoprotein diacylglyceryl transferase
MYPIIYEGADLIIYSYPLFMGLGWGFAYQIFFSLTSSTATKLTSQALFWGIFLSSWIGAKILFLLTYPQDLSSYLGQFSFWLGGGFVFYGGLLGALMFLVVFAFFKPISLPDLWPMLPALTFGHAIGRIGCLLAGCCFGAPTSFFWGISLHGHVRHPTQILEMIILTLLGIFLLRSRRSKSYLLVFYFLTYGTARFGIEFLRGDDIRGHWPLLSPSQYISLILIMAAGLLAYKIKKSKG